MSAVHYNILPDLFDCERYFALIPRLPPVARADRFLRAVHRVILCGERSRPLELRLSSRA